MNLICLYSVGLGERVCWTGIKSSAVHAPGKPVLCGRRSHDEELPLASRGWKSQLNEYLVMQINEDATVAEEVVKENVVSAVMDKMSFGCLVEDSLLRH